MYVLLLTGEEDLSQVYFAIPTVNQWIQLGLALGLHPSTLERIDKEKVGRIEDCKMAMLLAWLRRKDAIVSIALPTWNALANALRKIGEKEVADQLSKY